MKHGSSWARCRRGLSRVLGGSGLGIALLLATVAAADVAAPEDAASESPWSADGDDPLFDPDEFDDEFGAEPVGFPDPLERTNRRVFTFNRTADRWVLDPITKAYGWLVPGPVKQSIRNAFANLGEPATLLNDLLQLEWKDAGVASSRFLVNSTVGIAGFFDPATRIGLEYHRSDFGQTLALADTPSGPYLVIPLLGPNDVRDGFGSLADTMMHPLTWFLGPANFMIYGIYTSGHGLSTRERFVDELTALREGSIDYYAAMRNAYYQDRIASVWSRRENRRNDWASPAAGPSSSPAP